MKRDAKQKEKKKERKLRLKKGDIDILPRTVRNDEREKFVNFLGPIAYQQKDILFLVKKGQEALINSYEDLKGLEIAVKRKASCFKRFDEDTTLKKQETLDDDNMVKMFSECIQAGKKYGIHKYLTDNRNINFDLSILDICKLPKTFMEKGLERPSRMAVLISLKSKNPKLLLAVYY